MSLPISELKDRLKKALLLRNMKPVELVEKTGIPKSAISQYMSGYAKPKQDRIYLISRALDISESWLMGYDVPMEKNSLQSPLDDPDIRRIQRARKNMDTKDKEKMMKILEASFEDYFSDNYEDDDLDE